MNENGTPDAFVTHLISGHWIAIRDGNPMAHHIAKRHYSYHSYLDGRHANVNNNHRHLIAGPGEKMVLITADGLSLFIWRKGRDKSGQVGVCCSLFHHESPDILASDLILEAEALAWARWPGERLYTYVNPRRVKSTNPGYCFLCAGWRKCGKTQKLGLVILEKLP